MDIAQTTTHLLLARVYLDVNRPLRALLLLYPVRRADPTNVKASRLALRAFLLMDRAEDALAEIEVLNDREPSGAELAFALATRIRLFRRLRKYDDARHAWQEYASLCRASNLPITAGLS